MTPQLQRHRQKLTDFLSDTVVSMPPIPSPPMPQSDDASSVLKAILDGQAALLQGVNDLRANVVTRHQLQAFHDLQTTEMRTYVQAELVPVHESFGQVSAQIGSIADRVKHIEKRVGSGGLPSPGPNPHDPALRQIAFVGFPKDLASVRRIEAMSGFLKAFFPEMPVKHVDVSLNKDGQMTSHGFVELGSRQHVRHVISTIKSRNLKVVGFEKLTIKPENTEIDRNRNWALNAAEDMIKEDERAYGKLIEKKRANDRGIYVDGVAAFVQKERYSKGGDFVCVFGDLKLP